MKIVVVIEGGIVQRVISDVEAEVAILDLDTEGADQEEIVEVEGIGEAYIYEGITETEVDSELVNKISQ